MHPRRGTIVFWWMFFIFTFLGHRCAKAQGQAAGICDTKGCKCVDRPGGWKAVNCTFAPNQDVTFDSDGIHRKLLEIFIVGGKVLTFKGQSFNNLPGLAILYIGNTKNITIRKHAFFNSSSPSLRFDVENCDSLVVETEAFVDCDSTVIVEINKAKYCIVFAAAFSKLLNATFQHINQLHLVERTFEITKKDGIARHGPITKITFNKVKINKIPTKTFFSSVAEIRIQDSEIEEIQERAFSALQIASIQLINSTIKTIKSEACPSSSLIQNFRMSRCKVEVLESKAVMCAVENCSISHSIIHELKSGAVNTTSAFVDIIDNEIINLEHSALGFNSWNKILIEQNHIKYLRSNAIYGEPAQQTTPEFSFVDNDVFNLETDSLSFVAALNEESLIFTKNFFHVKCHCFLDDWLGNLTRTSRGIDDIMNTSFCSVDDLLARCYELKTGSMNMMNFTEMVCTPGNEIKCERYEGEEKIVNITNPIFFDAPPTDHSWLVLTLSIMGLVIIAIVATSIFLLISGGRWLKRKGYFRNIHYSPNETSNDEENTIVTIDHDSSEDQKQEFPEELTLEYLEYLKQRLDDPATHQETSEMIERLYEMFIIEDNYDNNNRQDDEAHLYEELANMQNQPPERKSMENLQNGPLSILRLMEERFNLQFIDGDEDKTKPPPPLVNEYSEPSDAAVHLYSELKQNQIQNEQNESKDSPTKFGSLVGRPLPKKPDSIDGAGPSS